MSAVATLVPGPLPTPPSTEINFDPPNPIPPELTALETSIGTEARKWTVQRNMTASLKTQIAHIAMDMDLIPRPKKDEDGNTENRTTRAVKPEHVKGTILEGVLDGILGMDKITRALIRNVDKEVAAHPIAPWIDQVKGFSHHMFGELLMYVGHIYLIPNPQKLYKRAGLHVDNGTAPRKRKGEYLGFNPRLKGWAFNVSDLIVKTPGHPYRFLYDRKKAEYLARDPKGPSQCRFGQTHTKANKKSGKGEIVPCPPLMHVERAARRYAVKKLVRDLWLAYHKRVGTGCAEAREKELKEKYGIVLGHEVGESRGV